MKEDNRRRLNDLILALGIAVLFGVSGVFWTGIETLLTDGVAFTDFLWNAVVGVGCLAILSYFGALLWAQHRKRPEE